MSDSNRSSNNSNNRATSICEGTLPITCPLKEKVMERRRIKAHFVLLVLIQFTVILGILEQLLENTDFYRERFYQRLARDRIHHVRPEENTYRHFNFVAHKRPPEDVWAERGILQFVDFARSVNTNKTGLYPPLNIRPGTTNGESLSTLVFDVKPEREEVYENFLKHCLAMTMNKRTATMPPYCPCFPQRQDITLTNPVHKMTGNLKGCRVEVADSSDTPLPTLYESESNDGISNYVTGWKLDTRKSIRFGEYSTNVFNYKRSTSSQLYNHEYTTVPRLRLPSRSEITAVEKSVQLGGRWKPRGCTARQRVAVLIPYRDRQSHLKVFLNHIHPFLQRQNVEYQIFVIEQAWPAVFNKASIMNAGYIEAKAIGHFDCYIFHDVDLVPENDHHLYNCLLEPRHLAVYIDKFNYSLHYESIFGGAIALTQEQFERVNGFSNLYYGWGGEDDDMFRRVLSAGYNILRFPDWMARYAMIKHARDKGNPTNSEAFNGTLWRTGDSYDADGLSSLKYYVITNESLPLYTWIYTGVPDPPNTWKEFKSTIPPFIPTMPPEPQEPLAPVPAEPDPVLPAAAEPVIPAAAADPVVPAANPAEPVGVAVDLAAPVQIEVAAQPPQPAADAPAVQAGIAPVADQQVPAAAVQNAFQQVLPDAVAPGFAMNGMPMQPNQGGMNMQPGAGAAAGLFQNNPSDNGEAARAMGDLLGGLGMDGIDPFDVQMELLINLWKASKARYVMNRYPWQRNPNFQSATKLWEEKMKNVPRNQPLGWQQQAAALQELPFGMPQQPAAAQQQLLGQFQQLQIAQQQPAVAQQLPGVQVPAAAQQPQPAVIQPAAFPLQPVAEVPDTGPQAAAEDTAAAVPAAPQAPAAAAPVDNPFGPPPPVVL